MENKSDEIGNKEFKINPATVLFFDMDGTLIETNLANFHSYEKAILSVNKSVRNLIYNPNERFNRSSLKNAIPNLSENEYDRIVKLKEMYYDDFIHETVLNISIADILFKYTKTNITVLVTNSRKERALKTLNHFSLMDKFNHIIFKKVADNKVKINKFQNAISILGVSSSLVVAFEDEDVEISDAKKAGIKIINPIIR